MTPKPAPAETRYCWNVVTHMFRASTSDEMPGPPYVTMNTMSKTLSVEISRSDTSTSRPDRMLGMTTEISVLSRPPPSPGSVWCPAGAAHRAICRSVERDAALTPVAGATPPLPNWERGLGVRVVSRSTVEQFAIVALALDQLHGSAGAKQLSTCDGYRQGFFAAAHSTTIFPICASPSVPPGTSSARATVKSWTRNATW